MKGSTLSYIVGYVVLLIAIFTRDAVTAVIGLNAIEGGRFLELKESKNE